MQEIGNLQVALMGMGTVFVCLVILIIIIMIMGKMIQAFVKDDKSGNEDNKKVNSLDMAEKQKIIAAISVAIAEELKTDVSKIQIHSITPLKK